jgi:tetratricopeptide (TPR) repeat protein
MLMKLKFFKEAEIEMKQFQNFELHKFFYECQVEKLPKKRRSSMVPFGFRMLNAELAQYLGRSEESISSLCGLLKSVNLALNQLVDQSNEKAVKVWNERKHKIQFSIVNILINRKNYEKAIEILEDISESKYSDKCALWSCIGKVYVQIGDIQDASDSFLKAKTFAVKDSIIDDSRMLINLSLMKIANNMYYEAYEVLSQAYNSIPENSLILNNMAFCLFYSGNLKGAIGLMEKHVHANPRNNLNENLIFNLCTLYELESAKSHQKKLNLLLWLNTYVGDGFNETCIQLQ